MDEFDDYPFGESRWAEDPPEPAKNEELSRGATDFAVGYLKPRTWLKWGTDDFRIVAKEAIDFYLNTLNLKADQFGMITLWKSPDWETTRNFEVEIFNKG